MPVDDVWKEPEFEKASRFWKICRFIALAWTVFLSRVLLGVLNKHVLYNEKALYRAIYKRQPGRALITISNHRSYLDAFVLPSFLKWYSFTSIAKAEVCTPWTPGAKNILHTTYLTSLWFTLVKSPPIVKGDGIFQRTMNFMVETLNRGRWVHIFPEGIVNQKEQQLLPFKPGIGRLVSECKTYPVIVPVYVTGMKEVIPMKKPYYPRIGKCIKVFVGDPIDICSDLEEMKKTFTPQQEVWQYIADKLQEKMEILAQEAYDVEVSTIEAINESHKEHSS